MKYNLKVKGEARILHIELPKISLAQSSFVLSLKDLTGKLLLLLEEVSLPHEIKLENLKKGKYVLTVVGGGQFFSALITT